MTVNPIHQKGAPSQVQGTQSQAGDEAFKEQYTKSEGYNKGELDEAVSERTRLTRTKQPGATRGKRNALSRVGDEAEVISDEPVYRTVMVDGVMHTLRLIAVA